jgi:methyl-accepting chemotaxis protein
MQWFKNLRTMTKILTLVASMVVLLLAVSATGYRTSSGIAEKMEDMYGNYASPAIMMTEAKSLAIQNRRMLLSMITADSQSEKDNYERRMGENQKNASALIEKVEQTQLNQDEKALLAELKRARDEVSKKRAEAISIVKRGELTDDFNARMRGDGDMAVAENAYIESFNKMASMLTSLAEDMNAEAGAEARGGAIRIAVTSALAVIFGIALGLTVAKMITGPIGRMHARVGTFSEGDLIGEFDTLGKDELAQMGKGLQDMADSLRNIIGSVKDASTRINDTAQEFSALAEETNASVEEFKANVDEMGMNLNALASTGEEVNASVEEVAAGAQTTAEKGTDMARQVDDAMKAGENGMNAVRNAVSGIEGVAKNAAEAAKSVQELGSRTRQIQNFVAQIGGIADQTNLLALNAAIEAARAGDAGRGFAVVAEEVRKLAEDSNAAAKNIEELAKTITGDLDGVVAISLENAKASQSAKDLSVETEDIIASMIAYLKNISGSTQDLAAVSEEQAASSEEIAEAVQSIAARVGSTAEAGENIRSGIGEVAAAAERMAQGADALSGLASGLIDILAFFKMEETALRGARASRQMRAIDGNGRNGAPGVSRMNALPARR